MSNRVCYFFGTFNPVHTGHLIMAAAVCEQFGYEEVLWIPSKMPPHRKGDTTLASFRHRCQMVSLAIAEDPRFRLSTIEGERDGPSYTYDTLNLLIPDFVNRDEPVPFIIGTDALQTFDTWHNAESLVKSLLFLQAPRQGETPVGEIKIEGKVIPMDTHVIDMPKIEISSTFIRQSVGHGRSCLYMTPQSVERFIHWNRLWVADF